MAAATTAAVAAVAAATTAAAAAAAAAVKTMLRPVKSTYSRAGLCLHSRSAPKDPWRSRDLHGYAPHCPRRR